MKQRIPQIADKMPVAKFWYKGSHTHPVLKVGLVIADRTNDDIITMYMFKDGQKTFPIGKNPIRSFRRDKISKHYSLRQEVRQRLGVTPATAHKSTLIRKELCEVVHAGV